MAHKTLSPPSQTALTIVFPKRQRNLFDLKKLRPVTASSRGQLPAPDTSQMVSYKAVIRGGLPSI
jgi:hypothetical protein